MKSVTILAAFALLAACSGRVPEVTNAAARQGPVGDVRPAEGARPADPVDAGIGAVAGLANVVSKRRDAQHTAARGHDFAVVDSRAGVEHL